MWWWWLTEFIIVWKMILSSLWFDNELNFKSSADVLEFMMICQWVWRCADVLCVSGRAAASSNCKPLWFLTCLSRAYCTWCYLFKAICTENTFLLPPPHLPHTDTWISWLRNTRAMPKLTNQQIISQYRNRPYMEFPPCHIWDYFPAIRGVSSRPYFPKFKAARKWSRPVTFDRGITWRREICVWVQMRSRQNSVQRSIQQRKASDVKFSSQTVTKGGTESSFKECDLGLSCL